MIRRAGLGASVTHATLTWTASKTDKTPPQPTPRTIYVRAAANPKVTACYHTAPPADVWIIRVPIPDHLDAKKVAPGARFAFSYYRARTTHYYFPFHFCVCGRTTPARTQSLRERESNRGLAAVVAAAAVASFIVRMGTNFYYQIKTHSNSSPNLLCSSFFKTIKCIAHLIHAKL